MLLRLFLLVFTAILVDVVAAVPTVELDAATVTGNSVGNVYEFLGIPFAQPPVGDLRFRRPLPNDAYNQSFFATQYGRVCPQQLAKPPPLPDIPEDIGTIINSFSDGILDGEDCLTINVIKPASATPTSNLPVLVWIFAGAFQRTGSYLFNGTGIVEKSIALGSPIVFVSMNHRNAAFGFLASKEVKAAGVGNLGLHDQRESLRWVQKYITAFGGDRTKVTLWGVSAGAISISLHMLTNGGDTEGLFRAAVMQSGAPIPVGDIEHGQVYYDAIVNATGCSEDPDTLQCLRGVDYGRLKAAVDNTPNLYSYQSLNGAWLPRADGVFLTDHPQRLLQEGQIARVPFITGNCDDEGTFFALSSMNLTEDADVADYVSNTFIPGTTPSQVSRLLELYPQNVSAGSPFDTGSLNALTPQFKRVAALLGDGAFQAPRRFFLNYTSGYQDSWVFLSKRFKFLPFVGALHTSDMVNSIFKGQELQDYIIRFTATLNPNQEGAFSFKWPKYTKENPKLLVFRDGLVRQAIGEDTYRKEQMDYFAELTLDVPL